MNKLQISLQTLVDKIKKADKAKMPYVVFKKPGSAKVKAFFQINADLFWQENFTESGFIFAPFDNSNKTVIFPKNKCATYRVDLEKENDFNLIKDKGLRDTSENQGMNGHIRLVKKGIAFLKNSNSSKVVLSRKEEIRIKNIDDIQLLIKLLYNYPKAYVYLWYHPKVGKWLGASPETFLLVKNKKFKTMALAGTQKYLGNLNPNWNKKEKEEQKFVSIFIMDELSEFNLKISNPYTKRAGNIVHICTEIEGEFSSEKQMESIIKKLHPTPAVCGIPKEEAKKFIIENEGYDRQFYTGYLGEFKINNKTELFVNLRCLQLDKNKVTIYVGGGITKDSIPEKEWIETVAKSEAMKILLN